MKTFWMFAVAAGLFLSIGGTAFAECGGHGQTVQTDAPMTVASDASSVSQDGKR